MLSPDPKYALSVALCLGAILCTSCRNDPKEVESKTTRTVQTELSTDVEAVYSDSGKVKARLNAKEMVRTLSKDPTIEMRNGLRVLFYDDSLHEKSRLTANRGIRYLNTNLTVVTGNVVVVNTKGDTLNSEELVWDQPKEKIYTQKMVKVTTPKEIIIAEGFESDINFENYTFYKVRGRVPVEH